MGCALPTTTAHEGALEEIKATNSEAGARDGEAFHRLFVTKSVVGKGAFTQVRLAKEVSSGRDVAVKVLDLRQQFDVAAKVVDLANAEGRLIQANLDKKLKVARREVVAMQLLGRHPRVIHLVDHFLDEAVVYIVMEHCPRTFPQALSKMPDVTESLFAVAFRQVFQALEFVHSRKIVHRDVKPDNFLCEDGGNGDGGLALKLCDFSLAHPAPHRQAAFLSGTCGTPPYMSPEMVRGEGYGTGTDVWSAGATAYALMLGDFPHRPGSKPSGEAMKRAIAKGVPEPSYEPRLPKGVAPRRWLSQMGQRFLRSVLTRERDARPTAARALESEWLQPRAPDSDEPSLRQAIVGALRVGAFAYPCSDDELLSFGQAREAGTRAKATGLRRQRTPESEGSTPSSVGGGTAATNSDAVLEARFSSESWGAA